MKLESHRFTFIRFKALCALPILWSLTADAAQIRCDLQSTSTNGVLPSFVQGQRAGITYSVWCQGEGLTMGAHSRVLGDGRTLQVRLTRETGGQGTAEAFGYALGTLQLIPGCFVSDTVPSEFFEDEVDCGAGNNLYFLTFRVSGQS